MKLCLQTLNQRLAEMVAAFQGWIDQIGPRLELAVLRLRWKYDSPGDRFLRGDHLIDMSGGQYWLHHVTGEPGYTITRHLNFPTLLEAMRAERNLA